KACGLHGTASWAASIALSRSRYTISKTRAGHIAGDTFRSACPVSFSRAGRLIERAERSDLEMSVWFALAGHSVGVSKAASLNFADRSIHGHGRRTTEVSGVHDQVRTRPAGLENCCLKLGYGGDLGRRHFGRLLANDAHLFGHSQLRAVEYLRRYTR